MDLDDDIIDALINMFRLEKIFVAAVRYSNELFCDETHESQSRSFQENRTVDSGLDLASWLDPGASTFPGQKDVGGWLPDVIDSTLSADSQHAVIVLGLALADLRGEDEFFEQGKRLLRDGMLDLWWSMSSEQRSKARKSVRSLPSFLTWDDIPDVIPAGERRAPTPLGIHPILLPEWMTISYESYFESMRILGSGADLTQVANALCKIKVVLDAKHPYFELEGNPIPAKDIYSALFVHVLIKARGNFKSTPEIVAAEPRLENVRLDRVKMALCDEILPLIEGIEGKGYRLLPEAWHSHANSYP